MILFRDRYFKTLLPKGPRGRKEDHAEDWFRGQTPVFLSKWGLPLQSVNMDYFSTITDIPGVVAGDFRKIATTRLAHHQKTFFFFFKLYNLLAVLGIGHVRMKNPGWPVVLYL